MLKNREEDGDMFEQEMEYRITNLKNAIASGGGHGSYTKGEKSGFEYALAIYRECVDGAQ